MKNKVFKKNKNKKINQILFLVSPFLAACNTDSKKILGLLGNATSEGLENLLKTSPPIDIDYIISTTNPESSIGNGENSLPIEISEPVVASPNISGYPLLDFTFNEAGTVDFTNISDVKNISISNSTAAVGLSNLSNDIEKVFIIETQNGDWNIAYKPDVSGTLNLDWKNNTGVSIEITSLTVNEVQKFLLNNTGNENIIIPTLNLDPDDTEIIQIENNNDGDIFISAASEIKETDGLKIISLKTFDDGNIALGTPSVSIMPDLKNIESIEVIASKNGDIQLGNLGSNISANKILNFTLFTEGGSINLGTIKAKKIVDFSITGNEFSSVSIGDIEIEESISNFTLGGDVKVAIGKFSGNGNININAINMTKEGINLDFSTHNASVDVITTNQNDTILLGMEGGKVNSGAGNDIITILETATGKSDINSGDGIDTITLPNLNGIDVVSPGGTNVNSVDKLATTHNAILADKIINFDPNNDLIVFGSITATESNFLSETNAASFKEALTKANIAMDLGKSYYFSYNVANATEGFGLLFYDIDDNGSSDVFLTLTGITTDIISHEHLSIV